jgi:hemerythrin superfamily protein
MNKLIEALKAEHRTIVEILNKVKMLGVTSVEGQNTLLAAKTGLLAHLKKEDDQIYPVLHEAAKNNDELRKTLELFANDMEIISKCAMDFFTTYATGGSGMEFAKDFGRLYAALSQRISKEEKYIYVKYEELEK